MIIMSEFENRIEGNDVVGYKSRVVASFINEGGDINSKKFDEYLDKLVAHRWIAASDKYDIKCYAKNGKLELEHIARIVLKEE